MVTAAVFAGPSAAIVLAGPTETVISGPLVVAAVLALAAGFVSFASPCVIPLVPGYLSYLVSLVGSETATREPAGAAVSAVGGPGGSAEGVPGLTAGVRRRAVLGASLFVTGFTVVFLAQSALVLGLRQYLLASGETLVRIGGVISIVMGLAMLGLIRPLQTERRIHARPQGRYFGALLLGGVFGIGWTVCLGPTFIGVNALAATTDWNGNAWRGLFLVLLYCMGLGVPFLLVAFGFGWATSAMRFLRRHSRTIQVVGACMLIAVGLAMVTGLWGEFVAWVQVRFAGVETVL